MSIIDTGSVSQMRRHSLRCGQQLCRTQQPLWVALLQQLWAVAWGRGARVVAVHATSVLRCKTGASLRGTACAQQHAQMSGDTQQGMEVLPPFTHTRITHRDVPGSGGRSHIAQHTMNLPYWPLYAHHEAGLISIIFLSLRLRSLGLSGAEGFTKV